MAASGCTTCTRCSFAQRGNHARPQLHSNGFPLRFLQGRGRCGVPGQQGYRSTSHCPQLSKLGGRTEQGRRTKEVLGIRDQLLIPTKNKATYISLKLNKLANTPSSNVEILLLLMSLQEKRIGRCDLLLTGSTSCLP